MAYPFQIRNYDEYKAQYAFSIEQPEAFWAGVAEHFLWKKKWDRVLQWDFQGPKVRWFDGAQLNITENCLDRHLETHGDHTAVIWEPNDPNEASRRYSYRELHEAVCRFAGVLRKQGVKKGDRVCIYMGMVPELIISVLAIARIGAVHSVVFGGFSVQSLADRILDARARFVITCDGSFRGAKEIALKPIVDHALEQCPEVDKVVVYRRTGTAVEMKAGRDLWWDEEMKKIDAAEAVRIPAETMDAEDLLFILYTSGSTGKPKGVVHTCAGYMIYTGYTFVNVFQYRPGQIHFCTADVGWITGHSYLIYGPLCAGGSTLMYEGIPTWPDAGRFWDIVQKHRVNILYTAPTAIRSLMTFGEDPIRGKDLSSLEVLGSVGEPINEEAWEWYDEKIGQSSCPIVDTWWQTETGGIVISNLAGVTPQKTSYATLPMPGIQLCLVDEHGEEIFENNTDGLLCIKFPWPGILRSTYGDHERCRTTYFAAYPGKYFTGDGAKRDDQGFYRITGRVDDVLKISGHRIGTAEVENAINQHGAIMESAVVGFPHEIKGQGIYAFVIYDQTKGNQEALRKEINQILTDQIGPIAKADKIQFVSGLPKTRSGKIMRRILRKIAEGETQQLGDTSTLLDPTVVQEIIENRL
ncbi:MAG TPA: acetate--CoA ligase [Saprospiraceae bacterium]|nr:acetate--CoA ligase [Saprospiraceae bacterium]